MLGEAEEEYTGTLFYLFYLQFFYELKTIAE